jgi:AmiR/NasT family two-component response regulator
VIQHAPRFSKANPAGVPLLPSVVEAESDEVFPVRWGKSPTPRALIVESDPLLRWALAETARRAGFEVIELLPGGLDWRRWSSSEGGYYAVVIVDLGTWSLGAEATRALERFWGGAAIVAMIPEESPDAIDALKRLGVRMVLVKPLDLVGLRSFLEARTGP